MANKYYICTDDNTIGTEADYAGRQSANLVEFTDANGFAQPTPLRPSEFGRFTRIGGLSDEMSIAEFDTIVGDRYNLWNYPIDEYLYTQDNEYKIVAVKFNEGYRLVQVE